MSWDFIRTMQLKYTIGVPQGSILGVLLFLLFVNDISQNVYKGTVNLYADDTLIYCTGNTVKDVESKLQICIDNFINVVNCYSNNKIVINTDKSCCMLVSSRYNCRNV
jgi:hypothetical protein